MGRRGAPGHALRGLHGRGGQRIHEDRREAHDARGSGQSLRGQREVRLHAGDSRPAGLRQEYVREAPGQGLVPRGSVHLRGQGEHGADPGQVDSGGRRAGGAVEGGRRQREAVHLEGDGQLQGAVRPQDGGLPETVRVHRHGERHGLPA